MRPKTPKLKLIDLNKCRSKPEEREIDFAWHESIGEGKLYLAKIDGQYFVGKFSKQWHGWFFDGWYNEELQLDKPDTNGSMWEGLWEIR